MHDRLRETDRESLDLIQLFVHTDALLRRFHHWKYSQQGVAGNPHRGQGKILRVLNNHPDTTQRDLSERMGIRQQSLGELLAKLEKSGYIYREPADDRRTMVIRLTADGEAAVPKKPDPDEVFGCLEETEKEEFRQFLLRISEHIMQTVGEYQEECTCGKGHGGGDRSC